MNDALLQPLLRAHEAALVAQAEGLDLDRLNRTFAALMARLREMAEVRVHKVELTPDTVGHLIPEGPAHGHAELAEWPEGLRELKGELYELKVHSSRLTAVPDWLSELSCLRTLDLGDAHTANINLKELPADLGTLWSLETLELRNLAGLEKLPLFAALRL